MWPGASELAPRVVWRDVVDHLRLRIPSATGGPRYDVLQKIAYSLVIFVAAPLMVLTGLAMSPAVTAAFPVLLRLFGGYQSARTIHFFSFVALAALRARARRDGVRSGFRRQMRAMTVGDDMKTTGLITRRRAIIAGLASIGGLLARPLPRTCRRPMATCCAWATRLPTRRTARCCPGIAGEGIQRRRYHVVSRHRHDQPRRSA